MVSGTQTAYMLALKFDMLPEDLRRPGCARLVENRAYVTISEVLIEPLPERLRLADVDDPATLVAESVDPWGLGNLARRLPVGTGPCGSATK